jgi:hypothetical protein
VLGETSCLYSSHETMECRINRANLLNKPGWPAQQEFTIKQRSIPLYPAKVYACISALWTIVLSTIQYIEPICDAVWDNPLDVGEFGTWLAFPHCSMAISTNMYQHLPRYFCA